MWPIDFPKSLQSDSVKKRRTGNILYRYMNFHTLVSKDYGYVGLNRGSQICIILLPGNTYNLKKKFFFLVGGSDKLMLSQSDNLGT